MALGDGIRRNLSTVSAAERTMLKDAILELHRRYYPGTRTDPIPGGVSWWFKQDEIHQATHVHGGPEFLPWHREIVNHFEELIREVNPLLSLHYWNWTEDATYLFTPDFMGDASGDAGDPWLTAGFYVPGADPYRGGPFDPTHNNPVDPPRTLTRGYSGGKFTTAQDDAVTNAADYRSMWQSLESLHNSAHGFIGGTLGDPHSSFRDPIVFLLHSNVDRLVAKWQTDPAHPERLNPTTVYSGMSPAELLELDNNVEPWSTGVGSFHSIRPWALPENQAFPHDYKHISVVAPPCYDTNQSVFRVDDVENPLDASTNRYQVIFNDVPEEESTWRAAVVRVYTCDDTTIHVKLGTEPGAPFSTVVGSAVASHGAHPHAYQDVRIWFQFTAGAVGTAPTSVGPVNTTLQCPETGQEFQFELKANSIHRPTVAVQMCLDQSGSMAWAAGTSGATRLQVLKDAASLFSNLIQRNNGIGLVRFDQDAYPPNDPTYGGLPITKVANDTFADPARLAALNAIAAHGAHGDTSVGDGLEMARSQLTALPPSSYDQGAILLLTDGIENSPKSIADVIGMGLIDNKVYAIGLGDELQVNTAALTSVAGATGGYLLLSGLLSSSVDDQFRLRKFFLQILAGVTNNSIVRDPTGYINLGTKVVIPFAMSDADINCRLILLTDFPVVTLAIETPSGQVIHEAQAAAAGVTFDTTTNVKTARFNLPVLFQAVKSQAGTWRAILEIAGDAYKKLVGEASGRTHGQTAVAALRSKGARYCLSVHSFSNLRMTARVSQGGYAPGSALYLRAGLTEYDLPVEKRAAVRAAVEYPDHSQGVLSLTETQAGVFEASMLANLAGIYRFRVMAEGSTYRGVPFTREQLLTGAVFHEVKQPGGRPPSTGGKDDLCRLLTCLLSEKTLSKAVEKRLKELGISVESIRHCVETYCRETS
jgi:hypothetical protein